MNRLSIGPGLQGSPRGLFFVLSGREEPEVQWAMIFTAGWTGVYDEKYRERCMQIGEKNGALQR
jgi:hypothetical protein